MVYATSSSPCGSLPFASFGLKSSEDGDALALVSLGGALQQQPVVYVDETGAPTGNADGRNPTGKRGWLWVAMFVCSAIANEIAWRNLSTDAWVTFKVFGLTGISLVFVMLTLPVIQKHQQRKQ